MSKNRDLPDFNHYQHNAPEYTEEILWHRVYAVAAAVALLLALLVWGIYVALKSDDVDVLNVDTLAPTAAIPSTADTETTTSSAPLTVESEQQTLALVTEATRPLSQEEIPASTSPEGNAPQPTDQSETSQESTAATVTAPVDNPFDVHVTILSNDITDAALTDTMNGLEPGSVLNDTSALQEGFLKLYFYTDLTGHAGDTLIYNWYRNDKRVAKVRVPVGSDRWRSHASKNISATMRGEWKVVVTDRKANTLASAAFYLK